MIPALLAAIAVVSYLLGNLNASVIASRYVFRRAVRNYGHGVEGLLRVNRVFGVRGVAAVVAVDAAKSLAAVLLGGAIFRAAAPGAAEAGVVSYAAVGKLFAGFCLLLGHCWPVLYGFRGGKGAVCALVTLLCVHVPLGLLSLAVCAALIALTRYVSLGVLCGAVIAPIGVWAEYGGLCAILCLLCVLILAARDRGGLYALARGKAQKLELKKDLSNKFEEEDF